MSGDQDDVADTVEKGIQLALDPNLITLPLHSTSASPLTNTSNGDSQAPDNPKKDQMDIDSDPPNVKTTGGQSLVNNPYGLFGQMPLEQLIPMVLRQKGPGFKFADLSEEAIEEEIEKEKAGKLDSPISASMNSPQTKPEDVSPANLLSKDEDEIGESNTEQKDEGITQEQFVKLRREMLEHINIAMNESSLALEFLSLLLSSVRESVALSSMSPFLKKTAPVGSLNSDKLPLEPKTVPEKLTMEIIDRGWKLRCLNESRSVLKENHTMLEEKLRKEHEYWKKIAQYISNKDVIFKLRDKSTGLKSLGVKYGYEDSGSTYKHDRGVAVLRTNPESNTLELVPIVGENSRLQHNEKFVRIRIYTKIEFEDDYILTGESSLDRVFSSGGSLGRTDHEDIRVQIEKLKTLIFEQEMMYQLKKECSRLISYGVTIENENKVVMELPKEKFEIELVSLDDVSVVNHEQDAPKTNDKRATLMLITLRMLLVVMFKKNLIQRLTSSIRITSLNVEKDILLIRPLLGRMRHQNYKLLLRKILKTYVLDIVEGSRLSEVPVNTSRQQVIQEANLDVHVSKLKKEIKAFDRLLNICKTKFEIALPGSDKLSLTLENPKYCNLAVRVQYHNDQENVSFDTEFSEFKEVEEILHFIVNEYIQGKG
ncbi:related to Mediator of RNA polymerase II transcription subunit 17 [Zygosaccharomyces bailii ISA1307]|uniref:Mediator of RNA polymerase II transcription subunit 17 n=1 Tax=Zygosaccharomyces bailii (strain CLIB 213 / ATCC 58445 / CBS 680 / BCRC 21525 / NBRC 1098 / NCYC 1416 / NRRL Y-2227) TaxID=1333698 RepID=A0A8J2X7T9_ZYGB2|nr:BN860_01596g1_1 [Zygosaccharomyces bailii CLIB 213]CDH15708.1 related to Mediator of RNA polymerase II transcription subunit 17 [Zygosaccharomyces bailii ISA1307]